MKHFIQFYAKENYLLFEKYPFTNLHNGLSCVWDFVEEKGWKFHWLEITDDVEPPVTEGDLYVSCWYNNEFSRVRDWALKYPKANFYIGGPLLYYNSSLPDQIPNFYTLKGNCEDIFVNGETSWNLKPPDIDGPIGYSVTLLKNRGCWWGKCNFCCRSETPIYREDVNTIPIVDHPGHKYIWLYTCAITKKLMHKLYPTFPDRDDVTYISYIKADKPSLEAYKSLLPKLKVDPKFLSFDVGIEFPGDNMLKYINKGATTNDYLKFIEMATKLGNDLHFNFILNWGVLTELDVRQLKDFMDKLSHVTDGSNISIDIYSLVLAKDRPLFYEKRPDELVYQEKTQYRNKNEWHIDVYCCKMSDEQKELNKKCEDLIMSFPFATKRNALSSYKHD